MKLALLLCLASLVYASVSAQTEREVATLYRVLDAVTKALAYMERAVAEINIDAVFCVRIVEGQLASFLEFQPEVFGSIRYWLEALRDRAKRLANQGKVHIYETNPDYARKIGFLLSPSKRLIWYPSVATSMNDTVQPVPCEGSFLNGTFSDLCFSQIPGCNISKPCMQLNTDGRQRGYFITHQILFWEMMEARNCTERISLQLRSELCSNVMRDAKQAVRYRLTPPLQDLFMEQVGLCGMWGFRDFHQPDWLEKILEWQQPSGCYTEEGWYMCFDDIEPEVHVRAKRNEKTLSDGCLAHKTAVALLALVANIRFQAEKIYLYKQAHLITNSIQ